MRQFVPFLVVGLITIMYLWVTLQVFQVCHIVIWTVSDIHTDEIRFALWAIVYQTLGFVLGILDLCLSRGLIYLPYFVITARVPIFDSVYKFILVAAVLKVVTCLVIFTALVIFIAWLFNVYCVFLWGYLSRV